MTRLSLTIMLVACVFMSAGIAMAQDDTADMAAEETSKQDAEVMNSGATLRGKVVDTSPQQEPIPNATVRIVGTDGQEYETTTDDAGAYEQSGLPKGRYSISVYKEGYRERLGKSKVVSEGGEGYDRILMSKKDTMVSFFQKFGLVFYPLIIVSIFGLISLLGIGICVWMVLRGKLRI